MRDELVALTIVVGYLTDIIKFPRYQVSLRTLRNYTYISQI
jgi:hypothetical protein